MRLNTQRVFSSFLQPILFTACATAMMAQSIIVFDAPNASSTTANGGYGVSNPFGGSARGPGGINGRGDIVGVFKDTNQGGKTRGFVRDRDGNFTVFDAPNASSTTAYGINSRGDIAGSFSDPAQGNRGFVRHWNGNFAVFDYPN